MASGRLLVGVDGGQTATKALVARRDGTVLAAGQGAASDHFHVAGGREKNRLAIHGAIESALAAAGEEPDQVASVGLGLTGAPAGGKQAPVVHEIVREILRPARITVAADYVTNLAGASGGQTGVVVIAGGGSIAYGLRRDGREALAGGFGYLLGDEGSAFDIGRRAIAAACRADDLRGEQTVLGAAVREHFGIETTREIPGVVYRAGFARERISLLAPTVVRAARDGDPVACQIVTTAGEELARTALGVIRQLFEADADVEVYLTGGVFGAGDVLVGPFRSALRAGWARAEAREPRLPPAVGGLILAARAVGQPTDAAWLDSVASSLPPRLP